MALSNLAVFGPTNLWTVSRRCNCKQTYHTPRPKLALGPLHISVQDKNTDRQRNSVISLALHLQSLAFVAPMCFDAECAANADRVFFAAVSIPILIAFTVIAYLLRPVPKELIEKGKVFEDPATGAIFQAPDDMDVVPERDNKGELAFRPISYTPWPVEDGYEGERVRIAVGPTQERQLRTYVFNKLLPQPSEIFIITLSRPLGIVFEYNERLKRAEVVDLIEGSGADQKRKIAGLNQGLSAVLPGDVLRAVTATNIVYPTKSLFGAVPPQRHIVVFGADKQSWSNITGALKRGLVKDGDVTLVMERRLPRD